MPNDEKRDKITIENGWAMCPICRKGKLLKLLPETKVCALPCKCKLCGQTTIVNIEPVPEPESTETSA